MKEPSTRRHLLAIAGTGLVGMAAGCATSDEGTPEEPPPSTSASSEPIDTESTPEPREVSFESSTGATVPATLYGSGSCGVVLIPQINLDRESWRPQAERLAAEGLVALPIDEGSDRLSAVLAAIEYLRTEQSMSDVILMGASTGGTAAIHASAAKPDRVDGTITLSAAGGVARSNRLSGEKLFVVSSGDEQRFIDTTDELYDRTAEPKHLEMYDGGAHGQRLFEGSHRQDLWTNVLTLTTNVCQD